MPVRPAADDWRGGRVTGLAKDPACKAWIESEGFAGRAEP